MFTEEQSNVLPLQVTPQWSHLQSCSFTQNLLDLGGAKIRNPPKVARVHDFSLSSTTYLIKNLPTRSISSSETISAGNMRRVSDEVAFSRIPSARAASTTACASFELRSTAAINPRRLTSPAAAARVSSWSQNSSRAPRVSTVSNSPSAAIRFKTASAAGNHWTAAKGRPMIPQAQYTFSFISRDHSAYWQAARQALGHRDHIRLQTEALVGKRSATAP